VTLVPVSTAFHQAPLRSAGAIASSELEGLQRIANDPSFRGRPLVLVQHHPPGRHVLPPLQWVDGLLDHSVLSAIAKRTDNLHVLHGHTHRAESRAVSKGEPARVFSAMAVVESEDALRLYDASPAGLTPLAADFAEGIGALVALA
jgi:hypothetical protein